MSYATNYIARKEYECGRCKKPIKKGEEYVKRMESYKVHGLTSYAPLRWHCKCPEVVNV